MNDMTINGTEFDDPREFPPSKRDWREYSEGVRTKVKEMWVWSYHRENGACFAWRHPITMTNRGACTFDGKPVKEEAERKLVAELFASVKPV